MPNRDNGTFADRKGIPVDAHGGPTVDPTKNVLDLVDAAVQRQDDLRKALVERIDTEKSFFRELLGAHDKRYEQRFEASQKALDAALIAQKDAVREAFAAQKEAINAALASADRAVSKAETAAEKRFEGVNEFRGQLADQQRTLMPRAEAEKGFSALEASVKILENFRTEVLSRGTGSKEGYAVAIAVITTIVSVIAIVAFVVKSFMP